MILCPSVPGDRAASTRQPKRHMLGTKHMPLRLASRLAESPPTCWPHPESFPGPEPQGSRAARCMVTEKRRSDLGAGQIRSRGGQYKRVRRGTLRLQSRGWSEHTVRHRPPLGIHGDPGVGGRFQPEDPVHGRFTSTSV